jgi:hypothetical protein
VEISLLKPIQQNLWIPFHKASKTLTQQNLWNPFHNASKTLILQNLWNPFNKASKTLIQQSAFLAPQQKITKKSQTKSHSGSISTTLWCISWRDSISRPIASVSSVADDTTRPRRRRAKTCMRRFCAPVLGSEPGIFWFSIFFYRHSSAEPQWLPN